MAASVTWSIPKNGLITQTVDGNPDTVVSVTYTVTATDGVNTVDIRNIVRLGSPNAADFTPFANLTEAQVISWVKASLPNGAEENIAASLQRLLERKANPPARAVMKSAPWNTCSQG
jgi:hypothetical protein